MDDSNQELERELKRLRPRRLASDFVARVAREPAIRSAQRHTLPAVPVRAWKWIPWSMAGVAAALMLTLFWQFATRVGEPARVIATVPVSTPNADRYASDRVHSVLYGLQEEPAAIDSGAAPVRRVRYRYVDTYTWKNPSTNASVRWSVPRDEVRLVRASLD